MVVSRMSSAASAQCEELQQLLDKREAELDSFKEERRDKDAAINFLKMKIATLQNQSRMDNYVVRRQTSADMQMLECPEDVLPTMGPHIAAGASSASAALAIAERDHRIEELELQMGQLQQESQRSARAVNRMLSGGPVWELEETRRRLADRDREAASLRQTLEWQEREIRRISEQSTSELEDLRQRYVLRDREVEDLKQALEDLESNRREHHLEVELRRQSDQNRRLTVQLQREEVEVRNLRKQLQEAREEVAWLWKSLHERRDEEPPQEANGSAAVSPVSPARAATPISAPVASPVADPAVAPADVGTGAETGSVISAARSVARKVCETFLGDDLLEALVPCEPKAANPPAYPANQQSNGGSAAAGAEAAAGDHGSAAARASALLGQVPKMESRTAMPHRGAEAAAGDKRPVCEAADAGAGVARRGVEDVDLVQEQCYPNKNAEKLGKFTYEGQEAIVVTAKSGYALKSTEVDLADDSIKTPDTVELDSPGTPESKETLDGPTAPEEPMPSDAEEPQEVCVTGGGALISINFFDDNQDTAAKEAKRQRVTRQIERRRQARGATAGTAAAGGNGNRTPACAGGDLAEASLQRSALQGSPQLRLPLPARESTGGSKAGSTAGSPRLDSAAQIATPTMSSSKGSPLMSARFEPALGSSPPPQTSQVSSTSPLNNSDTSSCLGKTPTLRSKFEGLRDEMKRRRSERTALMGSQAGASQDAQELAEAVVAEANANARQSPVAAPVSSAGSLAVTPGRAVSTAAHSVPVRSLSAQVPGTAGPAPAIIATTSAPAGERAPQTPVHGGTASSLSGNLLTGSSPVHSARVLKPNAIGPSPGERVIRTTAGGPERFNFERLGGSTRAPPPQVLTQDTDAGHGMVPPSPSAQNSSPFFFALASQSPSSPPSPVMSYTPHATQALPSPGGAGPHKHQPQRLRSVPQEHLSSARSNMSNASEFDRARRNTLSLSARSVTINHADVAAATRPSRPGDIPGEMEHDALHEAVVRFCMQRPGRYPLVRLSRGVYLYGNKKLVIAIHNDKLMVRIGGGFVHLESYLVDADRSSGPPGTAASGMSATASYDPTPRMQGAGAAKAQAARRR